MSASPPKYQHAKTMASDKKIDSQPVCCTSQRKYFYNQFGWMVDKEHRRLVLMRLLVIICLGLTAFGVGYGSYRVLMKVQETSQEEQYFALARKIETSTVLSVQGKRDALVLTASMALHFCPNVTNWPNCAISYHLFDTISSPLHRISLMRSVAIAPIVTPSQVSEFESFAHDFYVRDNHYPSGKVVVSFSISTCNICMSIAYKNGIYGVRNSNGSHYHDTTGAQQRGSYSDYQILTPVFQIGDMPNNAEAVMYNLHSEAKRAKAIDYSIDCVELLQDENAEHKGHGHESQSHSSISLNCTSMTEMVYLVQDSENRPATLTMFPVIANNNLNATQKEKIAEENAGKPSVSSEIVGFVVGMHNWDSVLSISTNDQVTGILAVLSNGVESHSFIYDNGVVKYIGNTDRHEKEYESQKYTFDASITSTVSTFLVNQPLKYTITLYPTDDWIALYETSIPEITCAVAVGLVIFTSLVFSLYDYLINRNVNEKELILQTKRQFVRYISHEIRTPMNVVFLGFQLLCTEMLNFPHETVLKQQVDSIPQERDKHMPDIENIKSMGSTLSMITALVRSVLQKQQDCYTDQFKDWLDLIQDIIQSADAAITVLNDLMSYDKLDTGTMVIEREVLPIWEIIDSTVHPFTVQAKAKNIELEIITQEICPNTQINARGSLSEAQLLTSVRSPKSPKPTGVQSPKASFRIVPVTSVSSEAPDVEVLNAATATANAVAKSIQLAPLNTHSSKLVTRVSISNMSSSTPNVNSTNGSQWRTPLSFSSPDPDVEAGNSAKPDDSHEAEIEFQISDQVVLGDKAKLSQVVRNLVSNALKFTPPGGKVTIRACWKPHGLGDAYEHIAGDVSRAQNKDKSKNTECDAMNMQDYIGCGSLTLSVTDSGAGMSEENLSQLFQEGVQFNAGKLQAGQGSGLGLWISKGIVELHRGKLSADSKGEGKGSTFTLELPLLLPRRKNEQHEVVLQPLPNNGLDVIADQSVKDTLLLYKSSSEHEIDRCPSMTLQDFSTKTEIPTVPNPTKPESQIQHTKSIEMTISPRERDIIPSQPKKFGGIDLISSFSPAIMRRFSRVLVVDDSEIIRKMVCRSLKSLGFQCQQCEDGLQCVEFMTKLRKDSLLHSQDSTKIHNHGIDLILMDFEMPRLNGPSAAAKLRELGITTPVIGVTGNVLKEDSEYYIQCGANKVIHKPFTVKTLERVLQELVLARSSFHQIERQMSRGKY